MNKTILTGSLLLFSAAAGIGAQTPYYYYYGDEKQYLELDTKHIFVSVADETSADVFASSEKTVRPFRADIPVEWQSKSGYKRYWTKLTVEEHLSDEAYLEKLSEIKSRGKDILVSPWFKTQRQESVGMSNFFNVMLKSMNDTVLLRQMSEREQAVTVYPSDELMPLWFVLSVTERSRGNAMEVANRFHETGLFHYACPDLMDAIPHAGVRQNHHNFHFADIVEYNIDYVQLY